MVAVTGKKVTISLPSDLVSFADRQAEKTRTSRSEVIARALREIKRAEEERRAAEGYRFYSAEAEEFAEATWTAVAEAWGNDR